MLALKNICSQANYCFIRFTGNLELSKSYCNNRLVDCIGEVPLLQIIIIEMSGVYDKQVICPETPLINHSA